MITFSDVNNFTNELIQKHTAKLLLVAGMWLLFAGAPEESNFLLYALPSFLGAWFALCYQFDLFRYDIEDMKKQFEQSI